MTLNMRVFDSPLGVESSLIRFCRWFFPAACTTAFFISVPPPFGRSCLVLVVWVSSLCLLAAPFLPFFSSEILDSVAPRLLDPHGFAGSRGLAAFGRFREACFAAIAPRLGRSRHYSLSSRFRFFAFSCVLHTFSSCCGLGRAFDLVFGSPAPFLTWMHAGRPQRLLSSSMSSLHGHIFPHSRFGSHRSASARLGFCRSPLHGALELPSFSFFLLWFVLFLFLFTPQSWPGLPFAL